MPAKSEQVSAEGRNRELGPKYVSTLHLCATVKKQGKDVDVVSCCYVVTFLSYTNDLDVFVGKKKQNKAPFLMWSSLQW